MITVCHSGQNKKQCSVLQRLQAEEGVQFGSSEQKINKDASQTKHSTPTKMLTAALHGAEEDKDIT